MFLLKKFFHSTYRVPRQKRAFQLQIKSYLLHKSKKCQNVVETQQMVTQQMFILNLGFLHLIQTKILLQGVGEHARVPKNPNFKRGVSFVPMVEFQETFFGNFYAIEQHKNCRKKFTGIPPWARVRHPLSNFYRRSKYAQGPCKCYEKTFLAKTA